MDKVLSDKGSLILYLDKVGHFTFPFLQQNTQISPIYTTT